MQSSVAIQLQQHKTNSAACRHDAEVKVFTLHTVNLNMNNVSKVCVYLTAPAMMSL